MVLRLLIHSITLALCMFVRMQSRSRLNLWEGYFDKNVQLFGLTSPYFFIGEQFSIFRNYFELKLFFSVKNLRRSFSEDGAN